MQDFLSDQIVNLTFRYGDDKQPRIPTFGSVKYTVLDHSGVTIPALTEVSVTTGPTEFESTISIPAINNSIDPSKLFERRTVLVTYTHNGKTYVESIIYRLIPVTNYYVTARDVRGFIGINENELPDSDIDMFAAYLATANDFTKVILDDALQSGTINEVYANDCITMQAVFAVVQSLKNRVAQSEKNGVVGFDRPKIEDFSEILEAAWMRYNHGRGILLELVGLEADVTLIVVTQDADPVTGA